MKRLLTPVPMLWLATLLVCGLTYGPIHTYAADNSHTPSNGTQQYRIGFHFWKPGKIYDEAMAGIKDGLSLAGIDYEEVTLYSERKKSKAIENLRAMDRMGLDLIYSFSSAGTKIAQQIGMKTPVIATVVNHPASLGVSTHNGNRKISLTGTSYYVDTRRQLELYLELFPHIKKVGMIYDKNNPAGYLAEEPFMRKACQEVGLDFLSIGIEKRIELIEATENLHDNGVDIIVIPTNRLVYKHLSLVLDLTHEYKIPVVSMNKQGVENGALAGYFADTYKLGRYTIPMAQKVLFEKVDPHNLPFQFIPKPDVILNLQEAQILNFEFPARILGQAAIVLQ